MWFVRLVAEFITPEKIGEWISSFMNMLENNTLKQHAGRLLGWAIVIIVLCTIIDWVFYWMKPENKVTLMRFIAKVQRRFNDARKPRNGGRLG